MATKKTRRCSQKQHERLAELRLDTPMSSRAGLAGRNWSKTAHVELRQEEEEPSGVESAHLTESDTERPVPGTPGPECVEVHSAVGHTYHTSTPAVKREAGTGSTHTDDLIKTECQDGTEPGHLTCPPTDQTRAETDSGESVKAERDADFKCEEGGADQVKCEPSEKPIGDGTDPSGRGGGIGPRSARGEGTLLREVLGRRPKACETDRQRRFAEKGEFVGVSAVKGRRGVNPEENTFKCRKCGESFDQMSQLDKHRVLHLNERPHVCSQCGMGFRWPSYLVRHQRVHSSDKPYTCAQCGKEYIWEFNLKHHQKIHFGDPYICTYCGKHFSRADHLSKHLTTHPDSGTNLTPEKKMNLLSEKSHKCSLCGRVFSWKNGLKQHQKIHTGEHTCAQCGKCFATKSNLVLHRSFHSDERPYRCECGKCFKRAQELKRHQTTHCADKTFISDQ